LKILQVSTYDIQGGAGIAAYRLHRGLRELGEECRMLVRHKSSADDSVIRVLPRKPAERDDQEFFLRTVIQGHYIDSNRTDISNTMFTLSHPGYDLSHLPSIRETEIINLQWVADYQSPVTLRKLLSLGKPVVWTLHDQWAFTGGCHYAAGCTKYREDCAACPQLADDPFDLPAAILQDKKALCTPAQLTIVTPSRWLASCVRESALFKNLRVEVIPYSLDTEFFSPSPKGEAKKKLGLPPDTVTLLFGVIDGAEKRKGFQELLTAIRYAMETPQFKNLVGQGRLKIFCFGHSDAALNDAGLPVIHLGYLDSLEKIRNAYCAADLFILPSFEDNLPNTILEALSCGTPVVAFAAGGIPDLVTDGVNGRLVPVGNSHELSRAILSLVFRPEELKILGRNGRTSMVEEYSLPVQARRYSELYRELCGKREDRKPLSLEKGNADPPPMAGFDGADGFRVDLETTLAPHFQAIFAPLLFQALKQYTPGLQRRWQTAEADRAARLEQIAELTRMLKESEADRAARLEQIAELTRMLKESEADRAQLNRQVLELNAHWTVEIRRRLSGLLGRDRSEPGEPPIRGRNRKK
jgi:glycosyltransferase involved in cell wall biosynthesis